MEYQKGLYGGTIELAKNFYTRKLMEMNKLPLLITPAKLEVLNRQAEQLRQSQLMTESHPVWNLPVKIESDGKSISNFVVVIGDM